MFTEFQIRTLDLEFAKFQENFSLTQLFDLAQQLGLTFPQAIIWYEYRKTNIYYYQPLWIPEMGLGNMCIYPQLYHRRKRSSYTKNQVQVLEEEFQKCKYMKLKGRIKLAKQLNLTEFNVRVWFNNRRAKKKREEAANKSTKDHSSAN